MKDTMELVDLIYWKPGKARGISLGLGMKTLWGPDSTQRDLDLQTRIAMGHALLFGHGVLSAFLCSVAFTNLFLTVEMTAEGEEFAKARRSGKLSDGKFFSLSSIEIEYPSLILVISR